MVREVMYHASHCEPYRLSLKEGGYSSKGLLYRLRKNEPVLFVQLFKDMMQEVESLNKALGSIHEHYKSVTEGRLSSRRGY